MKLKKKDLFGKILFILFSFSWLCAEYIDNENDDFKYIFAIINILIITLQILCNRKKFKDLYFSKQTKYILIVSLFSLLISLFYQYINSSFTIIAFKEFFYLSFPIVYAFVLLNNNESKTLDFYFHCILFTYIVSFFYKYGNLLNLKNIFSISFSDSYSIFESSYSTIFLQLFIYYYIRKKKILYIISAFFCFLSLKRLDFIFLIIFPLIYKISKGQKFSKKTILLIKIIFIISPFIMIIIYSKEFSNFLYSNFNINLNQITTGRYRLVNYIINSDFKASGLGSIELYLRSLTGETNVHCDMIKMLFETTIIGVFLLVNNYFNIVKRNKILTFILIYIFITMCLSQCITGVMLWFLFFMTAGYVLKNEKEDYYEKS